MSGITRREALKYAGAVVTLSNVASALAQDQPVVSVTVDMREVTGRIPRIWAECAGSDRAAITLRESWRRDLDRWRSEIGLKRVRFHGIFNDELGVFAPSYVNFRRAEKPNWQNVFQVYDGLVARGASPFVELSFMPAALASGERKFGFYGGNVTPPKSSEEWGVFIRNFVMALVDRYGLATVKTWPFEVWNEPNLLAFWSGTQTQYFELYKATALAIKSVDDALMVGGPSTALTEWLPEFAGYCADNNLPIDFFSTHAYVGDPQNKLFGPEDRFPQGGIIPEAMRRSRQRIDSTAFAGRPLWLSEWSADSPALIAHVVANCLPYCQAMSHWALSGTYEELGAFDFVLKEGNTGFAAMVQGIAKPAFNTYKLLHALGEQRLQADGPVLAAKQESGAVAALVWNLARVDQPDGIPNPKIETRHVDGVAQRFEIEFRGARHRSKVRVRYVDQARASPLPTWRAMGSPQYPTPEQIDLLRRNADIAPPETLQLSASGKVVIELPPEGVALVELG